MMNLIPEIIIGKKYRWRSFPIESLCPKCGYNMGNGNGNHTVEVVVISSDMNDTGNNYCQNCGEVTPHLEGWYAVRCPSRPFAGTGVVPYTQLEEIGDGNDEVSI